MVLSAKRSDNALIVVDSLDLKPMKTKTLAGFLKVVSASDRALIIPPAYNPELRRASRNLDRINLIRADSLNVVDVLKAKRLVIAKDALPVIERLLQPPVRAQAASQK